MDRVIIDMKNPNTLVSLAYIKTSKNPIYVFCNFILYLLVTAPNQSLRADEIKEKLGEKFGLNMPHQMIQNCTKVLKNSGDIVQLPNGAGYSIRETKFDAETFERTRLRLHEQEEYVLEAIVEFVNSHYNLSWSADDAKRYLSAFLDLSLIHI